MTGRRLLIALAVLVLVVLGGASPAGAHADLESTTPPDGSRVDTAPDVVVLSFTERVSSPSGGIRVLTSTGARIDTGAVDVDGRTVTVNFDADLGDGTYIVAWRVISADSHPVQGAFTFTVGDGPVASDATIASLLGDGSDEQWQIGAFEARLAGYVGTLFAAGGALYLAIVDDRGGRRLAGLIVAGACLGIVGLLVALPLQAQLATGLGIGAIFRPGVAGQVLADGIGLSVVITVVGALAIFVGLRLRGGARPIVLAAGGAVAVGAYAAAGHTTQTGPVWVTTLVDIAHVAAAASWFGGLALLAFSLHRKDEPATSADAVTRFSRLATVAVVAIGASGVTLGWQQVRAFDALTSTTYGRVLIAKVAVVALVVVIGAYNRTRLVPAVKAARDEARARAVLRWSVATEASALVVAVALTSALVVVVPARDSVDRPFSATEALGDGTVEVEVDPAEAGPTSIHVYLLGPDGEPTDLPDGSELTLALRLPAADIGPIERTPFVAEPGHYQLDGADLSVPGAWQITVSARVSRFEVETAIVDVPIRP